MVDRLCCVVVWIGCTYVYMYAVVRANLLLKRKPGFQLSSDDHHVTDTLRNNVIALIILWILYM